MNTTTLLILAIVVVVLIALGVFIFIRWRRSQSLRDQFGPEYKHAVREYGDQGKAEAELAAREKRVHKFEIRGLAPEEHGRFADAWRKAQTRFVDEPSKAVGEADGLIKEVMQTRGYPVGDFEQRTADISVDHRMSLPITARPTLSRRVTIAVMQRRKTYGRRWCTIARYSKNCWKRRNLQRPRRQTHER